MRVLELLDRIVERGNQRLVLATLISVERSAPRDPGAVMLISEGGELWGSISGGCVEAALVGEAQGVRSDGKARVVTYGISDADAQAVGLSCGGTIRVLLELVAPAIFAAVHDRIRHERLLLSALRTGGANLGARLFAFENGYLGSLGNAALDSAVAAGQPVNDTPLFVQRIVPAPDMYVFGASDLTHAMVRAAKFLGYHVTVCDARPAFAAAERFPDADRVVVAWPHEFLRDATVDERTALVVLTHDEKFDIPLLQAALQSDAGYIGVLGSRRTHAHRLERLRECGVSDLQLERLCAPIGLDIGARTPQETALAIAAEIVAERNRRDGGRLTGGEGSLHGRPVRRA